MEKFRDAEVKPFQFNDLKGSSTPSGDQKLFAFQELTGQSFNRETISDEVLRTERSNEKKHNFKIDNAVRDSRGLSQQEESDIEVKIRQEVNRRLEAAYKEAYAEGLQKGIEEGKTEAFSKYQTELDAKIEEFSGIIEVVKLNSEKILQKNKQEIVEFVKRFAKWIVLKEINEKVYLESLLEKLILELNARKNLIIKVGRNNFSQMSEVIQTVEGRLGQLSNVRVEIVPEINHPGIILESENGLIDGSIEGIFQNIDKIFEQVLQHE